MTDLTTPAASSPSRGYEGLSDLAPILAFASAATASRSPLLTAWHPGDVVWALMKSADQPHPIRYWPGQAGTEAVAWFVGDGELWLETLPIAEHLVAEAVRWAEETVRAPRAGDAARVLRIRAFASDTRRIAALEGLGYRDAGPEGVFFRLSLEGPPPQHVEPEELQVRDSRSVDPALRAAAHRAAWNHLEHLGIDAQSQFTTEAYISLKSLPVYDPSLDMLAVAPDGEFVANCIAWADQDSGVGVFEPVGVARSWRGQRVARRLMTAALHRLRARGVREARVGTAHFNNSARLAYLACGFEQADTARWWEKALP